MKEGVKPSQNLAEFCSLSFTLLSSYQESLTETKKKKRQKQKATSRFSHKNLIHSEHIYITWSFYMMKRSDKR